MYVHLCKYIWTHPTRHYLTSFILSVRQTQCAAVVRCVCVHAGTQGHVNYIVDPCFREQFEIAHVTPRYDCVLSEVPAHFIGTEEQVAAVVEIMSKEISRAFQQAGATLPPWRHTASMLSKWQPRKSEDVSFEGQTLDSRTPSLPQDLPPPVIRHHLGGPGHGYLQRHSTNNANNAWPARRHGATARVSLDDGSRKGGLSLDEGSRRKCSESPSTTVVAPRGATPPAGVVATVQQSINALSRKTSFNSVNHAVHLV